jgi:DNA-directed RNA polymerase specialized sigma24 family protein
MYDRDRRSTLNDAAVVARVLSGEKEVFSILVDHYAQRIFRLCMSVTRDSAAAEDCLQKSFLLALDRLE